MTVDEFIYSDNLYDYIISAIYIVDKSLLDVLTIQLYESLTDDKLKDVLSHGGKYNNRYTAAAFFPIIPLDTKIGCIVFFRDMLKRYINECLKDGFSNIKGYEYPSIQQILVFTIFHECRHAQQYLYMRNHSSIGEEWYEPLIQLDEKLNVYESMIIERDADKFAFKKLFNKDLIQSPVNSLDLGKVFGYILNLARDSVVHEELIINIDYE